MKFTLRPYQEKALAEITAHYLSGVKRVLLHLQGGGGKTTIFCKVLHGAHNKKKKGLMVVNRVDLVEQASRRLEAEGVPHGRILSGHGFDPNHNVYVSSIQTYSRRSVPWDWDFIVVDECHFGGAASYVALAEENPKAFYLAVTATPYQKASIRHLAEAVVMPIDTKSLVEQGYLVKPRYFVGKAQPDMTKAKMLGDDYAPDDAREAMMTKELIGDVVSCYREYAAGRRGVLFAVDVKHSKFLCDNFNANGVRSVHLDASHSQEERQEAIARLERRELDIICNCELFTTGVDIPCADVVILARPTHSLNLYIQMVCRGTRPYPGKTDFVVIDHPRNVLKHGFIDKERPALLDGYGKKKPEGESITTCLICYRPYYRNEHASCPNGCEPEEKERKAPGGPVTVDGGMVEISDDYFKDKSTAPTDSEFFHFLAYLIGIKEAREFKAGWLYHRVNTFFGAESHGKEICKKYGGIIYQTHTLSFGKLLPRLFRFGVERNGMEECYRRGTDCGRIDPTRGFGWQQRHLGGNRAIWETTVCRMQSWKGPPE